MNTTQRLDELLDQWEDARSIGQDLSAAELCSAEPDLLEPFQRRIAALQAVDEKLRTQSWAAASQPIDDEEEAGLDAQVSPLLDLPFDQLRFLAHGGLGTVFVARDTKLHRDVVLKFIRRKIAQDPPSIDRFLVEAEVTSRLDHPGIVPVYGLGRLDDGRPFYAMRYIPGQSLDDAIGKHHAGTAEANNADSRLLLRKLLMHFVAACQTIAYAHRRGIIHRDMKPEHILLGRYGETMVVDWGLAVPVGREDRFKDESENTLMPQLGSQSGSSTDGAGTPQYMSPEQAAGGSSLSPATDIYSLGATLYKLLAGRNPFKAASIHELRQLVMRGEVPPPSSFSPRVPKSLEAICLKAMARLPEARYATALDLAADVERFLADEPVSVQPETASQRVARWARRNRAAAQSGVVSIAAVALIAAAAAALLWQASHRASEARNASLQTSATFAARMLGQEIETRWLSLAASADDPQLHGLLDRFAAAQNDTQRQPVFEEVETWLQARKTQADEFLPARSWALLNERGIHLGRAADDGKRFAGRSFAHRAYFHGGPQELSEDEVDEVQPLSRASVSPAYVSQAFAEPTISFSVPVRKEGRIRGVLTMSLTAGQFSALQLNHRDGKQALLIDTRADALRKHGLVLFDGNRNVVGAVDAWQYVNSSILTRISAAGGATSAETIFELQTPLTGSQEPRSADRWITAGQSVLARRVGEKKFEPIGWTVLVQQSE